MGQTSKYRVIESCDGFAVGDVGDGSNPIIPLQFMTKENAELFVKRVNERDELLAALKSQHNAIDALFAMLIEAKPGFYPSKTGWIWDACVNGNEAILKAES